MPKRREMGCVASSRDTGAERDKGGSNERKKKETDREEDKDKVIGKVVPLLHQVPNL